MGLVWLALLGDVRSKLDARGLHSRPDRGGAGHHACRDRGAQRAVWLFLNRRGITFETRRRMPPSSGARTYDAAAQPGSAATSTPSGRSSSMVRRISDRFDELTARRTGRAQRWAGCAVGRHAASDAGRPFLTDIEDGHFYRWPAPVRHGWWDATRDLWRSGKGRVVAWPNLEEQQARLKRTKVILATAHRDHGNNQPRNLRALCQRCHLLHDRAEHRRQRWPRRRALYAGGDLFLGRYR